MITEDGAEEVANQTLCNGGGNHASIPNQLMSLCLYFCRKESLLFLQSFYPACTLAEEIGRAREEGQI
jgi:hypothetical protein